MLQLFGRTNLAPRQRNLGILENLVPEPLEIRVFKARLAQSVERKALNLVVVGSSPTVGD